MARTAEFIRAQAMEIHGADIGERRSEELAADLSRLDEAVQASRGLLDFNDEPARFAALLSASIPSAPPHK